MRLIAFAPGLALAFGLVGCGARPIAKPEGHIQPETRGTASIPAPVRGVPMPPPPEAREAEIKYSVVVANQPVRDVLLAMARETRVNFDIHPGVDGNVNLNAIDQTLKQILTRIARQVDVRWETDGQTLTVMPDTPFLRNYKVDYVNMSRDVSGTIGVQSQVVTAPGGNQAAGAASGASQNSSLLKVDNVSRNRFWETLERNVKDMLRETDKQLPDGSSETFVQQRGQGQTSTTQARTAPQRRGGTATQGNTTTTTPGTEQSAQAQEFLEQRLTFREAASVIVNPETGIVSVRATSRQHEKVSEFIALVAGSSRRQVLIEATVVEVRLNDRYQSGVDWSALGLNGLGYSFRQNLISGDLANVANPFFSIQYSNPNAAAGGSISSTIKLLDTFGNTRVLSSPKIMAINNQTAVLKVVDNLVYFSIQAQITPAQGTTQPLVVFTTTQNVVPVGFVMNVTAQISDNDMVVLNVRPTVSSKVDDVIDPNPDLARAGVQNRVPVIRSREFESVLRIPSGNTAILGGLMEDAFVASRNGLPLVSRIPFLGDAVSARDDTSSKRELVIFLRPLVIRDPSIDGELAEFRRYLPTDEFFRDARPVARQVEEALQRMERGQFPRSEPVPVVPDAPVAGGRP